MRWDFLSSCNLPQYLLGLFAGVREVGTTHKGGECVLNRLLLAAFCTFLTLGRLCLTLSLPILSVFSSFCHFFINTYSGDPAHQQREALQALPMLTAGRPPSLPEITCPLVREAASDCLAWHQHHQLCSRVVNCHSSLRRFRRDAETYQSALFKNQEALGIYHKPHTLYVLSGPCLQESFSVL